MEHELLSLVRQLHGRCELYERLRFDSFMKGHSNAIKDEVQLNSDRIKILENERKMSVVYSEITAIYADVEALTETNNG